MKQKILVIFLLFNLKIYSSQKLEAVKKQKSILLDNTVEQMIKDFNEYEDNSETLKSKLREKLLSFGDQYTRLQDIYDSCFPGII